MKRQLALLLMVLLGASGAMSVATTAQEQNRQQGERQVTLLNQDGEEAGHERLGIKLKIQEADGADSPRAKSGKIVVVGPDGEKRELDVSGAESIILNQSVQSSVEDGEKQTRMQGKAIVIGPDGKRTEFDLAEPLEMGERARMLMAPPGLGHLEQMIRGLPLDPRLQKRLADGAMEMPGQRQMTRGNVGLYMIGVHCNPVSPALRYHLDLSDGAGLVVDVLTENSPAAAAGIQQHDILLYANQADLSSVNDLVKAVDKAGEEGLTLSLNLLRKGKEVAVEVEPIKRPAMQAGALPGFDGRPWNQAGPGVNMADRGGWKGFEQQMEQMEEQMRKMHEQMKMLQDQAPGGKLGNPDQ